MDGGWEGYKPKPEDAGRIMVLRGYGVERARIPEYFNTENDKKLGFYFKYKLFGWPFGGGWAEQPAYLLDIVERLETESRKKK
jgi:hypothetical protein